MLLSIHIFTFARGPRFVDHPRIDPLFHDKINHLLKFKKYP